MINIYPEPTGPQGDPGAQGPQGSQGLLGIPGDTISIGTYLVSGATVSWVTGFTFEVGAAVYYIDGVQYSSAEAQVSVGASDPTDDRIDVIALDSTGTLVVIPGVAATPPAHPDVDPSLYLEVTFVLIEAGSASASITQTDIYTEGVEWTCTPSAGSIVIDSPNFPRSGTKDIEGTAVAANTYVLADNGSAFDISTEESLIFFIRNKAAWSNNKGIRLGWYNSGSLKGIQIVVGNGTFGFDRTLVGTYQQIVVPISTFAIPIGTLVDSIRWEIVGGGGAVGFYLDDWYLQTGVSSPSPGPQGPQGPQGYQGVQGAQGTQGFQGNQGFQGFQGNQGFQGFQGNQGFQGTQGVQGDAGVDGLDGNQGTQGVQGAQGFQGFQGTQGSQGDVGPTVRAIMLIAAYTPGATGADVAEVPVPYAEDGTTPLTYSFRRITLRVQTAGGAPSLKVQLSTAVGAFSATDVGTVTLGSGDYEASITAFGTPTVDSGNKLRCNFLTLATAQNWTCVVEISNP